MAYRPVWLKTSCLISHSPTTKGPVQGPQWVMLSLLSTLSTPIHSLACLEKQSLCKESRHSTHERHYTQAPMQPLGCNSKCEPGKLVFTRWLAPTRGSQILESSCACHLESYLSSQMPEPHGDTPELCSLLFKLQSFPPCSLCRVSVIECVLFRP